MSTVKLKPIQKQVIRFWIRGTSPLITHKWSEKSKTMIREKQAGKKTKTREKRDPQQEAMDACYRTEDGSYGFPGLALKASMIGAAHKDIGIEKTLVRKALFLRIDDEDKVLPMECGDPVIREDTVRVGAGSADLRYRPMWSDWRVRVEFEMDAEMLNKDDVVTLVNRAGFGVGIGEWRPEKGGEYGRFEIDPTEKIELETE